MPAMAATLETTAAGLCRDLGRRFTWDTGLDMALLTFESAATDDVTTAVARHLPVTWQSDTVDGAPEAVLRWLPRIGGLRPGQWLAHTAPRGPFLVALFWPWTGGSPVSLRVGLVGSDAGALLKSWVGID